MPNSRYFLPILVLTFLSCTIKKDKKSTLSSPVTVLYIIQDEAEYKVDNSITSIALKAKPFRFCFHTKNTDEVFLHASTDSIVFLNAVKRKWSKIDCFRSDYTFSEPAKNESKEILVGNNEVVGYHCLFAKSEPEFIRFDSVIPINDGEWKGIRTINNLTFLRNSETISCDSLVGKTIYLTFSPGIEKQGYGVRLSFF